MKKTMRLALISILLCPIIVHATFVSDDSGTLYKYDELTNTSTLIGNSGNVWFDIALDPTTNLLYGYDSLNGLHLINQMDGQAIQIGNSSDGINGLTFGSDGTLYGSGRSALYTIDLLTGVSTAIGLGGYTSSGDIAFDNMGNLYISSRVPDSDSLWTIDINTGVGTLLGEIGFESVYGLNYVNNTLYGYTFGGETISIDTTTGIGTFLSSNDIQTFGADGSGGVRDVNAPLSLTLLGMGLFGLAYSRKRISEQALFI